MHVAAINNDVAEHVHTILGVDQVVVVLNNRLVVFFNVFKITESGAIIPQKCQDVSVTEVVVSTDPSPTRYGSTPHHAFVGQLPPTL